ncbi:MAG: sugar phosphate isomerase/epimerase family protein [Pseudomonadales bacterium]
MRRREFLKYTSQSSLGLLLANSLDLVASEVRRLDNIGLQLFTVDKLLRNDFEETLKQVAAIGYRQIEFSTAGGLQGRGASEVKALLAELKLEAPNGRLRPKLPADLMSMPREQAMKLYMELAATDKLLGNLKAMLPEAKELGYENIILSAVPPAEMTSRKALDRLASLFNEAGSICQANGMKFGYHNHDFDFKPVDGTIPFEYLIEKTDADAVTFQLDLYWATKAGKNPAEYLKRYSDRISSCHMKDMAADGSFTDVGSGTIDFPSLTRIALDSGIKDFFVEHDKPEDPMATATNSFNYLHSMRV